MSKPATIIFYPNGFAAVCDEEGKQMPEYQGPHARAIGALERDGIDWQEIPERLGRPIEEVSHTQGQQ